MQCGTVCKRSNTECLKSCDNLLGRLRNVRLFISLCSLLFCFFSNLYFNKVLASGSGLCQPDAANSVTWQVALKVRERVDLCSNETYVHLPSTVHKWYDCSFVTLSGTRGKYQYRSGTTDLMKKGWSKRGNAPLGNFPVLLLIFSALHSCWSSLCSRNNSKLNVTWKWSWYIGFKWSINYLEEIQILKRCVRP